MRFPINPAPDESIPGALARGIRVNVLERSSIFFEDAGVTRRSMGLVQVLPPEDIQHLATFMGCDAALLEERCGTMARLGNHTTFVDFGDLRVPVGDVAFERRRVSPLTLGDHGYHRDAWLFTLLPYCPYSLERLIESCPACGLTIGWAKCWGVGFCEWCRTRLAASAEPALAQELVDGYRLFASLLSPSARQRTAAVERLPLPLQDVASGTLVTMALRLGQVCRPRPVLWKRREEFHRLDAQLLSSIVSGGAAMLQSWPNGFIRWSKFEFDRCSGDLTEFRKLKANVRLFADSRRSGGVLSDLFRAAIPPEFGGFDGHPAPAAVINSRSLRADISLKSRVFDQVRVELEDRRLPTAQRIRSQLNPEGVKRFKERYPTSRRLNRLTFKLMLPTYALEQMVCLKVLPEERERSVKIARHGMCVQQAEFDRLSADIRGNARGTRLPLESIPLEAAARQIGGREKPWGAIFDAIRRGKMEYWLSGPAISSRTVRILPSALEAFRQVTFDTSVYPNFPFESSIVSAEVEEILNVHPANLPLLVEHGLISFERSANKNFASRVDVVALAEKMVSAAELSYALKVGPRQVAAVAFRMGARPLGCGWSRAHLVALGVLAPLPHLLGAGKSERL